MMTAERELFARRAEALEVFDLEMTDASVAAR